MIAQSQTKKHLLDVQIVTKRRRSQSKTTLEQFQIIG